MGFFGNYFFALLIESLEVAFKKPKPFADIFQKWHVFFSYFNPLCADMLQMPTLMIKLDKARLKTSINPDLHHTRTTMLHSL